MSLLFDQNISFRIVKRFEKSFPDCKHVSTCDLMNANDHAIWKFSKKENLTIVTFDSDFFDLSIIKGHPPKIIWIRGNNLITSQIVSLLERKKAEIRDFIANDSKNSPSCLELV